MSFILSYRNPKAKFRRARAPSNAVHQQEVPKLRQKRVVLLSYEELPEWHKDNHFMRTGYRPISNSCLSCAQSLGYLHNETLNIYTHLIPAVCYILGHVIVHRALNSFYPEATLLDHITFHCNVGAAVITLALSSAYHTLMNHSMHVSNLMLRVDYVGILVLILGSFFSGIYVGFYCEPLLRWTYWTMIITLSIVTSTLVLHPKLQGIRYRDHRTWAFILTALSGFAPIIHGMLLYGWKEMWLRSGMPYYLLEGLAYGIGAFFFITRIPESIWPGTFDIWFSSHQLFHTFVVLASLVHLYGVWAAFDWNYEHQRICPVAQ
ncbi:ADIPOR-like receptor IZH2 [Exophiala dermatitidis]|uniref:Hemolysin III n=1 Tax=Exophiala dermatitidis (strain ATCC 34100 / CBS 525.76 / NIH/UT8656) TaxID=858893 RepID=H6C5V1_EXODN|nr:uncharacterized protein HMPREF1120_07096 [Exophiala dermatitidis NIH/UT8656]KAJ4532316.1 hypothetical protein HRR76_007313 [Exophiala dermatitidis]EHY59097.1 hypothetical protein HMPREF1120_07096 [Exophiala dermatitidis NIH/UT8656]KAJ4546354.1 hypothetical protein HRR77_004887 [Exophiala dermatitidis]KAJ4623401.1 hypothetical protein HRR85_000272 [Exophiala dermatitidis]KAJ4625841.1 hypothetical protein HRR88_004536 [Exophiala dermatitidis]